MPDWDADYAEIMQHLPQVGATYRLFYDDDNHNNKTIHILAIVDNDQVVYKWWGKHKRRWFYDVEWVYFFYLNQDKLTLVKKPNDAI